MAIRFYTSAPLMLGPFSLGGPEAHHLSHVRRLGVGDEVTLFNGDGKEYRAVVGLVAKREVELIVVGVAGTSRELEFQLHVASALPKGDRLDFLIEKLTELGASDFTPLLAERSVVIVKEAKIEKLERAVIEASKQCGRNVLMKVHPPITFAQWSRLDELPPAKWIAHPGGEPITALEGKRGGVAIAIGPEGGFTDEEVSMAGLRAFRKVSLGPRILRVETAALVAAAAVSMSALVCTEGATAPDRGDSRDTLDST
jgi:16S rRNA (uracil1498-N3)-methyltransferase